MAEGAPGGTTDPGKDNFTRFAGESIPEHCDRGLGSVLFAG